MTIALRAIAALLVCGAWVSALAQPAVPGAHRLLHAGDPDEVGAGLVLIGELKCASCHVLPEPIQESLAWKAREMRPLSRTTASGRIERFMRVPAEAKPGTAMPSVHLSEDESQAIYAFLDSIAEDPPDITPSETLDGANLYHSVGCVACHAPRRDPVLVGDPDDPFGGAVAVEYPQPEIPSIPILLAGDEDWVMRDPHSARMVQLNLSKDESLAISAYLRSLEGGGIYVANPPASASKGAALFQAKGCAQCHTRTGVQPINRAEYAAIADLDAGCLAANVEEPAPDYALDDAQRKAIQAALRSQAPRTSASWKVLGTAAAMNCLACHERDGYGGVEAGRAPYFKTTVDADLGDEGRIPPTLTNVGAKLTLDALIAVLKGHGEARPYMATRMPVFAFDDVEAFARTIEEADRGSITAEINVDGIDRHHRNHYGRELVGADAFGCVSCHELNGHPSLGIPAIDLAHAPTRLRPEWFMAYMRDPAALRPGTRMPAYFPEGKSTYPKLFGGNVRHQVEAIWIYLREIDQTRLPVGMEATDEYVLAPTDTPIVHRTFMKDVGSRAIAVGFPEGVHFAFDATKVRLALAWRGGFLDANATWNDRFSPYIEPMSDDRLRLPDVQPISVEGSEEEAYQFLGFELDADRVPTFRYRYGEMTFRERITPLQSGKGLRREVTIENVRESVRFRIFPDEILARTDEVGFVPRIHSEYLHESVGTLGASVIASVPLTPVDGRVQITVEIEW